MRKPVVITAFDAQEGEVLIPWHHVAKFSSRMSVRPDGRTLYDQGYVHTIDGAEYRVSSDFTAKLHVIELCQYDDDDGTLM